MEERAKGAVWMWGCGRFESISRPTLRLTGCLGGARCFLDDSAYRPAMPVIHAPSAYAGRGGGGGRPNHGALGRDLI